MGWSWSLFFCQDITEDTAIQGATAAAKASGCSGSVPALRDGRPLPPPSLNHAFPLVYVDNANLVALSRRLAGDALAEVKKEMRLRGLGYHEVVDPSSDFTTLGVVMNGRRRSVRHTAARAWRLYLGIGGLLSRGRCTGRVLRVIIGHLVNFFMLLRPALSLLDVCYVFIETYLDEERILFPTVNTELRHCRSLIFLAEVHMGAAWSNIAFCSDASGGSDSSEGGFCLMQTLISGGEAVECGRYRERWRFKEEEEDSIDGTRIPGCNANYSPLVGQTPPHRLLPAPCRPRQVPLDGRPLRSLLRPTDLVPPLHDDIVDPRRWHLVVKGGWKYKNTIHCKEGRVCLSGLERLSRMPLAHGRRVLSLCDNMPAVLAFDKGRSRDPALRALCRRGSSLHRL